MKRILTIILGLFLSFSPHTGQTFSDTIRPEECIIPTGFLLVEEVFLKATIDIEIKKAIDRAVDEAVAVAVKEEQKKNVDLQFENDRLKVTIGKRDTEIKNLKTDQVKNVTIGVGIGIAGGVAIGTAIFYFIDKAITK
jgi:hypothetical protein